MNRIIGFSEKYKTLKNFYIHIPFCLRKCHYCSFPIHAVGEGTQTKQLFSNYISYLTKQMNNFFLFERNNIKLNHEQIDTIYIGGGTPSLLSKQDIHSIINIFHNNQRMINSNTQITLEMNPQQIGKLRQFEQSGINRFSVGIQTINQNTLKKYNRISNTNKQAQNKLIMKQLKEYSVHRNGNINLDFIVDFNYQQRDYAGMFEIINQIQPKHLTMYCLEVNEDSYLHRNYHIFKQQLENISQIKIQKYKLISQKLIELGYDHYQVSNYSKSIKYRSKHNRVYWQGDKQFAAFGMGATSLINGKRVSRPKKLTKYYKYVDSLSLNSDNKINQLLQIHQQTESLQKFRWILLSRIRTSQGVNISNLIESYFEGNQKLKNNILTELQIINKYRGEELIQIVNTQNLVVKLTVPLGYLFADEIGYRIIQIVQQYLK